MIAYIRYRIAWYRWFLLDRPYKAGDPALGVGATRVANRELLLDRYLAREPKRNA